MNAFEQRRTRGQGGFTLIELLVVIAILAVLAGVVVFAVNGINNTSQATACKTEARTAKTAVQAFYAQETKYPTADNSVTSKNKQFIPGFLETSPKMVKINYGGNDQTEPTYTWIGACVGQTGLSSTP